jgi:hypothetical protein
MERKKEKINRTDDREWKINKNERFLGKQRIKHKKQWIKKLV